MALVCAVYAVGYLREDERSGALATTSRGSSFSQLRKYYGLTPLFVTSMLLVALANNLGVMWVAIEATTLASVFLVTFYGKATSLEAAWKYAMIGGVGCPWRCSEPCSPTTPGTAWRGPRPCGLELVRAGPSRRATGPDHHAPGVHHGAAGYGTKAGLAPMHTWKPDAYSEAPVPSAAILSTAMLNCALYGLVRFYILTSRSVGPEFPGGLLLVFGVLSMGISVPFVLVQKNFRRLLAYHTIDHAGIMAMALGVGGKLRRLGLMLHMTYHTIAKSLLFLCAGNVYQHYKTDLFAKVKGGVIHVMPLTGAVFLMAMLAIVGMPPFSLFQSEFLIVRAAFGGGHYFPRLLFILFGTGIFAGRAAARRRDGVGAGGVGAGDAARPWRDFPCWRSRRSW